MYSNMDLASFHHIIIIISKTIDSKIYTRADEPMNMFINACDTTNDSEIKYGRILNSIFSTRTVSIKRMTQITKYAPIFAAIAPYPPINGTNATESNKEAIAPDTVE